MMRTRFSPKTPAGTASRQGGFTLLEIMITLALITTGLLAAAGSFTTSLTGVQGAQRQSEAAVFLSTVMESVNAQGFGALLTFNGDRIFDGADENHSRYAADLQVFTAAVDLIQVNAIITDLNTGQVLTRTVTLRSNR